ncbi:hypothetical protein BX616_009153 [Lobosporangium transversale]|uniref:Uncharacterized protein n=1 Tax=Lobosporangium transversale TaxID=64571 RepID=A0A1Y2H7E7_9FUNG|nr:hypothetical protein BCR41DRAFT_418051 [Lobosporangium transversale]KAF9918360.1 hypothetical protein BX616_009153 [Lobosporangium transversale]ORZ28962.1 hypothetical protein BCR41DRAFT_418051 [Lobosporangium transversale]|eukprot:XP_021886635.1 hypothetical protein BCR41DRAFT_418051 [Lobosporangium transversale]
MSPTAKYWQSVQSMNETFEVEARPGTSQTNGEAFVLFQDVEDIFPGVVRLQYGKRAISFMVDADGNRLLPLRVPYAPDIVMQVVQGFSAHKPSTTMHNDYTDAPEPIAPPPTRPRHADRALHRSISRQSQSSIHSDFMYDPQLQHELELRRQMQQPMQIPADTDELPFKPHTHTSIYSQLVGLDPNSVAPTVPVSTVPMSTSPPTSKSGPVERRTAEIPEFITTSSDQELKARYRASTMLYESFKQHMRAGLFQQADAILEDFRRQSQILESGMPPRLLDIQQRILEMRLKMIKMQQQYQQYEE